MEEKISASRNLLQATYTPIIVDKNSRTQCLHQKAWEKWRLITSLKVDLVEAKTLRTRFLRYYRKAKVENEKKKIKTVLDILETIISILPDIGTPNALTHVALFKDFSVDSLILIAREVLLLRKEDSRVAIKNILTLENLFQEARVKPKNLRFKLEAPKYWKRTAGNELGLLLNRDLYYYTKLENSTSSENLNTDSDSPAIVTIRETRSSMLAPDSDELVEKNIQLKQPMITVGRIIEWARQNNIKTKAVDSIQSFLLKSGISSTISPTSFSQMVDTWFHQMDQLVDGFQEQMKIEPVGFLHLEKLNFTPAGIERGELVYSLPLAPGEEVNIAHKEWSNTSEEFEEITQDFFEDFSEEGVSEKNEMAESTDSQKQHSSGFNTGVTASGGYGPVNITATANYNVNDSASNSEKSSLNQSSTVTSKASSRTKKDHKISFKVASISEIEDQSVRKIINPDKENAKRVDYYQLIRKWKIDLLRYGLRLTYDLTIPEPGSDILSKIIEIKELNELLENEFNFPLEPESITFDNYLELAAEYKTAVPNPPDEWLWIEKSEEKHWASEAESANPPHIHFFTIEVDDDYEVWSQTTDCHQGFYDKPDKRLEIKTNFNNWLGRSGTFNVVYQAKWVMDLLLEIKLTCRLKDENYKQWKMKSWEAIRVAAEAQYLKNKQLLKEKRDNLAEELGGASALMLRKMEREEVMKGVLRWLFGPTFEFVPDGLPANLYSENASVMNEIIWGRVLSFGEFIKFIHQAIEWENMLYFLYPYFWSHQTRWELKKYLDHPDSMHKVFLKAGSARVVLTIRPGFEEDFLSIIETGEIGVLPNNHPYLKISDEMQAFAKTNYPGILAANPADNARPLLLPKQKIAWEVMQKLFSLLEAFKDDNDRYPTQAEGLSSLTAYLPPDMQEVPIMDPWGYEYQYTYPGIYGEYDLLSFGANGVEGGEGEDADITSWAAESIIGTWHEYTPTSAMDIKFGEEQPEA